MLQTSDPRAHDPLFAGLIAYEQLPARLGISRQVLDRIVRKDRERFPPRVRIGRKNFVVEEDVRRWLLSRFAAKAA